MRESFDKALTSIYKDDLATFRAYVNKLDGLNAVDKDGRTLLMYAVLENNLGAIKILLDRRVNINIHDEKGWTALHYAVNEYFTEVCELLVDAGADVNAKDGYGNTVIWRAVFASKGRGGIIRLLLSNGADPTIENDSAVTALTLADTIGNYDVKQFLEDI